MERERGRRPQQQRCIQHSNVSQGDRLETKRGGTDPKNKAASIPPVQRSAEHAMSGGHAPYLMPDGKSLRWRAPGEQQQRQREPNTGRGKYDIWATLQREKVAAGSEQELQEIRAIERVGLRRRRRWLNDKLLRDMAGPMTAGDMERMFKPVPFGSLPPPSAFAVAMDPQHAPLWEHFRNIDLDKEARVLERWEQHNREQQAQQRRAEAAGGGALPLTRPEQREAAAGAALQSWARVSRQARLALKKANVHSVLSLEMQVLAMAEQPGRCAELQLELPDGFARLLVHGLAEFHGLASHTRTVDGAKCVVLSHRQRRQQERHQAHQEQQQEQQQQEQEQQEQRQADVASCAPAALQQGASADGLGSSGAAWLLEHGSITCTDVLLALHELPAAFDQHNLVRFVKQMHGVESESVLSEEYVLV